MNILAAIVSSLYHYNRKYKVSLLLHLASIASFTTAFCSRFYLHIPNFHETDSDDGPISRLSVPEQSGCAIFLCGME
ncbi:hypothetical protein EDB19DRAFT_1748593, partial [Suillus lakei]